MTMLDDAPVTGDDELDDEAPTPEAGSDATLPPYVPGEREESPFARWRSNLPLLVIVVLAWMVAAGAVVLWKQNQDLRSARDDRREAAEVASDFTTAVLSYDHRDLEGSVDDVLALSTPDWGRQYEDAWFQDQQPIVEELQAQAEVVINDVMVGDSSNGVLPVVVTFNASIESTIGTRRLDGSYLQLDLTKVDGSWLVDDMTYLANTSQSLDTGNPGGGDEATPPTETTTP